LTSQIWSPTIQQNYRSRTPTLKTPPLNTRKALSELKKGKNGIILFGNAKGDWSIGIAVSIAVI
jgi:hypothetical protein